MAVLDVFGLLTVVLYGCFFHPVILLLFGLLVTLFMIVCEACELLYTRHYMRILTGSCGKLTKGPVSCSQVIALREGIPWIL